MVIAAPGKSFLELNYGHSLNNARREATRQWIIEAVGSGSPR
jgi:hypothetical protein